jgi:hypothetical protein
VARSDQSDQPEQGNRPDEGREQAHEDTAAGNAQKRGKDPPPKESADDTDDEIAQTSYDRGLPVRHPDDDVPDLLR